jgi:hypothetical protein
MIGVNVGSAVASRAAIEACLRTRRTAHQRSHRPHLRLDQRRAPAGAPGFASDSAVVTMTYSSHLRTEHLRLQPKTSR